jgi:rfaE bifunctional protein nucleotidyltransferase chain/domain
MMTARFLQEDLAALQRVLGTDLGPTAAAFDQALEAMCRTLRQGGKILAFGNGGSAADAEHFVGELTGRFLYDRAPLPGIALTAGSAGFTAISNDYGYDLVFERQLRALGKPGDLAFGITTSGNSKNVILALQAARELRITTVAMTGAKDSQAATTADITLRSPSRETPRIQELHAIFIHSLCRGIEATLFPKDATPLPAHKIIGPDEIPGFARALAPYKSVFTNGCYDILHPGHVTLLQTARAFGDLLVLGLNSDDSVKRLKGPTRPYHPFANRALVLAALAVVDFVVGFDEDTPLELIRQLTPRVLVKGGDYTRETIVGADWVESHGGEVRVVPLVEGHSTTRILQHGT